MSNKEKILALVILGFVGWFASYYYNEPILLTVSVVVSLCSLASMYFKSRVMATNSFNDTTKNTLSNLLRIITMIGLIMVAVVAFIFWYVSIPCLALWFLYMRENKLSQKWKKHIAVSTVTFFVILQSSLLYINRTPELVLSNIPSNNEIQSESVIINGNVSPKTSIIKVNGAELDVDQEGNFTYDFKLRSETNTLSVEAINGKGKNKQEIIIARIFTEAELVERQRLADEKEKKKQEAIALQKQREQVELNVYYQTPAGKICKAHPEWSKEECQNLSEDFIWIGMEYDMLVYKRGRPNHINPSNYGRGTRYQYCWSDYTPSCFYDNNDDGLIDSYN